MVKFEGLEKFESVENLLQRAQDDKQINITNVKGGLQGFIAISIFEQARAEGKDVLFILPTELEARKKYNILRRYLDTIVFLPAEHLHYYFSDAFSLAGLRERQRVLSQSLSDGPLLAVCSMEALLKKLPDPKLYKNNNKVIGVGEEFGFDNLIDLLSDYGYERVIQTEAPGQFSVRGGIVDIFLMTETKPIRVDFFDDEVDSIKYFDAQTQRSESSIDKIELTPFSENWLSEDVRKKAFKKLEKLYKDNPLYDERFDKLEEGIGASDGILFSFTNANKSFIDFLRIGQDNKDPIIVWADPDDSELKAQEYIDRADADYAALSVSGDAFKEEKDRYFNLNQIKRRISACPVIKLYTFSTHARRSSIVDMDSRSIESFAGQPNILKEFLTNRLNKGYYIHFFAQNQDGLKKIKNYLKELEIPLDEHKDDIQFSVGEISEGFELAQDKIVFLNESDFFKKKQPRKRRKDDTSKPIDSFTDLKVGDYVVHDENGIGKYLGLEQLTIDDVTKDMMAIEYADGDKLYVPVEHTDSVQVYIGTGGDVNPKVSTLGTKAWSKAKSQAKKAAEDMADELIALYSKREHQPGYAFSKDTTWQRTFEEAFPYTETDDQLQAIEEIKKDMEKSTSMDRLLCGDVGYGKTEVAFRAAFKAAMDMKQTAILVPTTVLAQQHYQSAIERFKDFPVNIEVINRFKTKKQQKEILERLKKGEIDILIGTHRLVSKDVEFKDLGLLIIDEEQRFGVKAKERIKQVKENVDVLTLSATPIPRTLSMSLSGVRDMSVIEEPPPGRQPIQTYVMNYSGPVIKDAIERELARNGQVYYIHNRVNDIDRVVSELETLCPTARIITAHGQMTGLQLENVMQRFLNQEYDILVSTTIVENGLDVQNANTMIVEQGDRFGLSQLYQLRGRVGRSPRQAYTYITHDRKILNEDAQKRLKAIRDFTAFGSGFKIAMQDLEIRGAGNILGSEQSGHMVKIGYELYMRILNEAIKEKMTGEVTKPKKETQINIKVDAYVPKGYIIGDEIKFEIYRKLARLRDWDEYYDFEDELIDRFGDIPDAVYNLMLIAMIKNVAGSLGISNVSVNNGLARFTFEDSDSAVDAIRTVLNQKEMNTRLRLNAGTSEKPVWTLKIDEKNYKLLKQIFDFLDEVSSDLENEGDG